MTGPEIERLDGEIVYRNRWMRVREDRIRRGDGVEGIYGVVEKLDYALIVPFDGTRLHLVEQYRYAVGGRYWEFPQGSWEDAADADMAIVAAGELAEETGLRAGSMLGIGRLFQAYGYATQAAHVFLARDLRPGERALDDEEHGLITASFDVADVESMIDDGSIADAATVAAFHLFLRTLDRERRGSIDSAVREDGTSRTDMQNRLEDRAPGRQFLR